MNLKKQLAELFIIGFQGTTIEKESPIADDLAKEPLGGVILFDRCLHDPAKPGNIVSCNQLSELTNKLQDLSRFPLFVCIDQEGGMVQRLKPDNGFTSTVSAEKMGTKDSINFTFTQGAQTAKNLHEAGINVNFAPVVDLNINRINPIIGKVERSFSAAPDIVIRHASVWVDAHRNKNIISCIKHFPGHGSSTKDSHLGFVDISTSWDAQELIPYRNLIDTGSIEMIMVGHLFNSSLDKQFPATLSRKTITDLLRKTLGYEGVVVTDDMQMKAITSHYGFEEAICKSLSAGVDMVVIGNNLEYDPKILNNAVTAVKRGLDQGLLSEDVITAALSRIQKLKRSIQVKNDE